jgi:hypothetical protein
MNYRNTCTLLQKKLLPAVLVAACLMIVAGCQKQTGPTLAPSANRAPVEAPSNAHRDVTQGRLGPDVEEQRQLNNKDAAKSVDKDAAVAIEQTTQALAAVHENQKAEALAALERATGKVNILLARNSRSALIPIDADVVVIDTAPEDSKAIAQTTKLATSALNAKDLPDARVLLAGLISEIRLRTTNLPLATYPVALTDAARLVDQGKNSEAEAVLRAALNTLVIVDHVTPLPLILAQAAVKNADAQRQDPVKAQILLRTAKNQLKRAQDLGYLADDSDYKTLNKQISDLESTIQGKRNIGSRFSELRDRIASFLKRQKEHERR